jgi:putative lipoic acid-binding regulatory protein
MSGKILVMTRQNENQATADLTMRATCDGQYVNFNVYVIINAVIDLPPYIVTPIPDVVMDEFPKIVYIDLNGAATDPDDPDELIEYSMLSNSNEEALSATMSGRILMLERLTEEQAEADIAMRATSDGQYVDFNIHVIMNQVEGVEESAMSMMVYPNPTNGMITIHLDESQSFDYEVYNLMGQCLLNGQAQNGSAQIDLGSCHQGVCFVAVSWGGSRVIQKVVVQ